MTLDDYIASLGGFIRYDESGNPQVLLPGIGDEGGWGMADLGQMQQQYQAQQPVLAPPPQPAPEPTPEPQGVLAQPATTIPPVDQYAESIGATWIPPGDEGGGGYWRVPGRGDEGGAAPVSTEVLQREAQGLPAAGYSFTGADGRTYYAGDQQGDLDYWARQMGYAPEQVITTNQYGDRGILDSLATRIGEATSGESFLDQLATMAPLLMGGAFTAAALTGALPAAVAETVAPAAVESGLSGAMADTAANYAAQMGAENILGATAAAPSAGVLAEAPVQYPELSEAQQYLAEVTPPPQIPVEPLQTVAGPAQPIQTPPVPETIVNPDADIINWQQAQQELINKKLQDAVLSGALKGGITSAITGANPIVGALAGGGLAGVGSLVGSSLPSTGNQLADQAIASGAMGAVKTGLQGGDPALGALSGAMNPVINSAGNMVWNAAKGVFENVGDVLLPSQPTVTAEAPQSLPESYWTQTAQVETPTQADVQPPVYGVLAPPPNYDAEYQAELARQQEQSQGWSAAPQDDFAGYQPSDVSQPIQVASAPTQTQTDVLPDYGAFAPILGLGGTPPQTQNWPELASSNQQVSTDIPTINQVGTPGTTQDSGAVTYRYAPEAQQTAGAVTMPSISDLFGIVGDPNALDNWDLQGTPSQPAQLPVINDAYANQAIGPYTTLGGNPSPSAQDTLGLQQMGYSAGLRGPTLDQFVASGGTIGSTAAGGGGVGYGAGIPFGASGGAGGTSSSQGGAATAYSNPAFNYAPVINLGQMAPAADRQRLNGGMDPSTMALFGAALGALGGSQTEAKIQSALPDWLTSQMATQAQPQPYTTQATQWGTQSMIPGQQANYMAGNQQQADVIGGKYLDPMQNPAIQGQLQALQDQFMTQTLPQTMGAAFRANPTGPMTDNSTFLNPSVTGGGMLNTAAQNLGRGFGQAVSQGYQTERGAQNAATQNALAVNPIGNAFGIQRAANEPLINFANATTGQGKNIFTSNPIAGAITGAVGLGSLFGTQGGTGSGSSNLFRGIANLFGSKIG